MYRGILLILLIVGGSTAWAQSAVSARAGLIHYIEGRVVIDQQRVQMKRNEFHNMEEGGTLETRRGRAEILLNPGTFLRLPEQSSFRLVSADLTDTRLAVLSGKALIEVDDLRDDNSIIVEFKNQEVQIRKNGLYHLDTQEPGRLRVYDGEAWVGADFSVEDPDYVKVKKGRQVDFGATIVEADKFDRDETDELYRWSSRRARYISRANAASATTLRRRRNSGWIFNPFYGMYSFVPAAGYGYSPFGLTIYSPATIRYLLAPRISFSSGPSFGSGFGSPVYGGATAVGAGSIAAPAASAPAAVSPNAGGGVRRR